MGIVYLATREKDYEQQVALKVIGHASGLDAPRRFHVERQVLASLVHPNVVRLLDGGEVDGVPYLVMEYVDGGRLDDRCRRLNLPLTERVRLFTPVARAIAHAHERGVLHRDLKPANVLVTAEGVPRVTDFGLARPDCADPQSMTTGGGILGTPAYMAPEQIAHGEGRNRPGVDVYGLGALLYRLVTDEHPYQGESPLQTCVEVCNHDPPPVRRLRPDAPRDLETIVATAMAREIRARYASACDLADDLDRFLARRPILARRPSPWDRLGKWAQRHPAWLTAWVLTVVLLMGTGVALLADANRALVREGERLRQKERDQVELLHEYALSLERLFTAMAPGDPAYQEEARRFLELTTRLAESSDLDEFRYDQARAHFHCGRSAQGRRDLEAARKHYRESTDLLRPLARSGPGRDDIRYDLARSLICEAEMIRDFEESRPAYLEALRVCDEMCDDFPDNLDYRDALANRLYQYGTRLAGARDGHGAPDVLARAIAIAEELCARPGARPSYLRNVILPLESLSLWHHVRGRPEEAERYLNRAMAVGRRLWPTDPANRSYQMERARMLVRLAELHFHAGRLAEAERSLEHASAIARKLASEFPESREPTIKLLETLRPLAEVRYARGDLQSARALFGEIVERVGRCLDGAPDDPGTQDAYLDMSSATPFADQMPVDRILTVSNAILKTLPIAVNDQGPKARALAAAGREAEAVALIEVEEIRPNSTFLLSVAAIEARLGRMAEARAHYEAGTTPDVPGVHSQCFYYERLRRDAAAALGLGPSSPND
jgi:tetratricopeptide (TPR) repeat protein